jgi:hypothetical protein
MFKLCCSCFNFVVLITMANKQLEQREEGQEIPGPSDREEILACDESLSPLIEVDEVDVELPCSQLPLCAAIRIETGSFSKEKRVLNLADPHDLAILAAMFRNPSVPENPPEDAPEGLVQIIRTTRTEMGGLVWIVLNFLCKKMCLELTEADFEELVNSSVHITELAEAVPIILLTVQTVATTHKINRVLRKWAEGIEDLAELNPTPVPDSLERLKPWDGPQFWSFEDWARAAEVVARFLLCPQIPSENEFRARVADIRELAGTQGWKVPIMVATLFGLRKATWLWNLLDRVNHLGDV